LFIAVCEFFLKLFDISLLKRTLRTICIFQMWSNLTTMCKMLFYNAIFVSKIQKKLFLYFQNTFWNILFRYFKNIRKYFEN